MIRKVQLKPISLNKYKPLIEPEVYSSILSEAEKLRGKKILHLNTTKQGGVGEILQSLIPLMLGLGLKADWFNFDTAASFFNVSKNLHNFLQGKKGNLEKEEKELYLKVNQQVAKDLSKLNYELWVIHDPQPAAAISFTNNLHPSIWRCHIDTSKTNKDVWHWFSQFLQDYDRYIFTLKKYIGPDLYIEKCKIIPVAIDPLSIKNKPLPIQKANEIVRKFGIDTKKPLILQVSRFDPWKDPWGVIDAYRIAKRSVPNLQLALVGVLASDDPEGNDILNDLKKYKKDDPDIFILSNLDGVGPLEVNAFQVSAKIVIQKSIREGFGLTVSEAMWKEKPVIGGKAGGIIEQIIDGETGFLITTAKEVAEKINFLLSHPEKISLMGKKAKERVRKHFLITRYLLDHLKLYNELVR